MRKYHAPPAKKKYDLQHPTVSFRVSKELHLQLEELQTKSGKTIADVFKEALGVQQGQVDLAYWKGFKVAKTKYGISYPCPGCKRPIFISDLTTKQMLTNILINKGGLIKHKKCPSMN